MALSEKMDNSPGSGKGVELKLLKYYPGRSGNSSNGDLSNNNNNSSNNNNNKEDNDDENKGDDRRHSNVGRTQECVKRMMGHLVRYMNVVGLLHLPIYDDDTNENDSFSLKEHIWLTVHDTSSVFNNGHEREKLSKFFKTWTRYSQMHSMGQIVEGAEKASWISIFCVTVGVILNTLLWLIPPYFCQDILAKHPDLEKCFIDPIAEPFYTWSQAREIEQNTMENYTIGNFLHDNTAVAVTGYITLVFAGFAWLMTPVFFYLFCYILSHELISLKERYEKLLLEKDTIEGSQTYRIFESLRAHHAGLCDLVEIVDNIFCGFIFSSFLCNLTMACCNSYILATGTDWIAVIPAMTWLFCSILHLSILCIGGGKVNEAAHSLYDSVYLTSFKHGACTEMLHKIGIFLHKLQGPSIGFTAWNLYVVDKSTILTVASTYLAYVVVLLTLQQ